MGAAELWGVEFTGLKVSASVGYNLAQHYGNKEQAAGYGVETGFHHGFSSGMAVELPITESMAFRYEFNYVTRGSRERISVNEIGGEPLLKPAKVNVYYHLGYAEFPLLFKFTALKGEKFSLAANAGVAMSLKTNGRYELEGLVYFPDEDSFTNFHIRDESDLSEVNQFDFSLIYGGEIDFRMWSRPVTLGYRFTIGWDYLSLPTFEAGGAEPVELRNQSYCLYLSTPLWQKSKGR